MLENGQKSTTVTPPSLLPAQTKETRAYALKASTVRWRRTGRVSAEEASVCLRSTTHHDHSNSGTAACFGVESLPTRTDEPLNEDQRRAGWRAGGLRAVGLWAQCVGFAAQWSSRRG